MSTFVFLFNCFTTLSNLIKPRSLFNASAFDVALVTFVANVPKFVMYGYFDVFGKFPFGVTAPPDVPTVPVSYAPIATATLKCFSLLSSCAWLLKLIGIFLYPLKCYLYLFSRYAKLDHAYKPCHDKILLDILRSNNLFQRTYNAYFCWVLHISA